jgi:hypothetical protein
MDRVPVESFQPVDGDIIGQSSVRKLWLIGVCLLLIPVGGVIAWAWWTEFTLGEKRLNAYAGSVGVFMFVAGIVGVPVGILTLFMRTRLIFGQDRLQRVQGEKRVTLQIPYKNIARMQQDTDEVIGKFIGIDLHDPDDPETLNVGTDKTRELLGWHYRLVDDSWAIPLEEIRARLGSRINGS